MRFARSRTLRGIALATAFLALGTAGCGGSDADGTYQPPADRVTMTLTASAASATAVVLRWSGAAPTRYEVYMNGAFYASAYPSSASSTAESVRISGLSPGTSYCFVVYAVYFPFGVGGRSNDACAATLIA